MPRLIVCLTGMPGAGKSTVASFLKEKGFSVITMGDAVREEAKRQGLEPTDSNLGSMMIKLRQDLGQGAVAHLILKKLERDSNKSNLVIDGIRSIPEVEVLKKVGTVKLLAIHASQDTRFKHLVDRKRSDAPTSSNEFAGRDKRELSVGISEAIALADETISNNEITIDELKEKAWAIVSEWLEEAS
ncbi:nucleoside monophosphate kinase [Nitrososphaera sp.]|uniref:nucleoside monophosphate kinase n=1 Tax=Nitrososphaera sp. TaxID=1971748 RepID=UPI00317540A1